MKWLFASDMAESPRLRNESAMSGVIRFRAGPPACGLPRSRGAVPRPAGRVNPLAG
jgi:hypothetical protein